MTWEQLVIPVLLVLALLIQRLRMRAETVEDAHGDEVKPASVPVTMHPRVSSRESHRPSAAPRTGQSTTDPSAPARRWQPPVAANPRDMRRGIVLMAVLGPCQGLEPQSERGGVG